MELSAIARATGIRIRTLRYVLDHRVVPGAERASRGHRVTREFTAFEAFGIACAAALLDAGVRRPSVTRCMRRLTTRRGAGTAPSDIPLWHAFTATESAAIEVAGEFAVRVVGGSRRSGDGWIDLVTGRRLSTVPDPLVRITLDASAVRGALRRNS
jgi:hypothetical protein